MAATAILDFWNREILLANEVQRVEAHQHAKYRQNVSISCEDIKIFRFLQMAAAAMLYFQMWNFIGRRCLEGPYA